MIFGSFKTAEHSVVISQKGNCHLYEFVLIIRISIYDRDT